MAVAAKNASRGLGVLAVLLYVACFALPDRWIRWSGPVVEGPAAPPSPGVVQEYYFGPEMVSSFTHSWGVSLDWAGWMGHLALFVGFVLLAIGQSRWAVGAVALALIFGVARHVTLSMSMGFLAGYYVWLASMVVLGLAAVVREWLQGNVAPAAGGSNRDPGRTIASS